MNRPMLRLNDGYTSTGLRDLVKELQTKLNQKGAALQVDGLFGPATEDSLKQFQREHGLKDDGIVGPLTWSAIKETDKSNQDIEFPTTFSRDDTLLFEQLKEAAKYKAFIEEGVEKFGFKSAVIGGIGSRESCWGLILKPTGPAGTGDFRDRKFSTPFRKGPIPADGGFGRGLMQIDYDAHEFARSGNWQDPRENILYGCKVLADSRDFIQKRTALEGKDLLRAALAGYNAGAWNVVKAVGEGLDCDFFTTGRDYSAAVLNRSGFFQLNGWD